MIATTQEFIKIIGPTFYSKPNPITFLKMDIKEIKSQIKYDHEMAKFQSYFFLFSLYGYYSALVIQCEYKPVTDIDVVDVKPCTEFFKVDFFSNTIII